MVTLRLLLEYWTLALAVERGRAKNGVTPCSSGSRVQRRVAGIRMPLAPELAQNKKARSSARSYVSLQKSKREQSSPFIWLKKVCSNSRYIRTHLVKAWFVYVYVNNL